MVSDATASSRATSWNDGGGPRPARRAAPHVRAAARRATARRAGGGRRRGGAGRLGRRARRRDRRDGARRDARAGRAHGRCDRPRRGGSRRHARIRRSAHAPLLRRRAVGRIRDAPQRRRLPRGPGGRWRDPRDGAGDDGGKRRGAPRAPRPPDRRRARARHDDDRGEERLRPRARGGAAAAPDHRRREGDRAQRRGSHVPRRARAPRAVHRRPTALRARSARRPRDGSQPRDIAAGGHADRDRAGRDAVRSHASRGDRRGHDQRGARPRPRRSHRRAGRRAARRHRRPRHRRRARARVPHGRAAHRRGLRGRQARRVAEMSTELQLLLVLAVVDALAYGPGLWRYPIVDGAGWAGCAAAAEAVRAGRSVALVEAGPDYGAFSRRWPRDILDPRRRTERHDWGFEAELRRGVSTDEARARVVGGCSAHNECAAVWPPAEDIDHWRVPGWSSRELAPLVDRVESATGGAVVRRRPGAVPTRAWRDDELSRWQAAFLEAAVASGYARLDDASAPGPATGVAPFHANVRDGVRWNAAFAFLDPVRDRVAILDRTVAVRLVVRGDRAASLECRQGRRALALRAETFVLCAGTYGSPALLLRSRVRSPELGRGLQDHPGVALAYRPRERSSARRLPFRSQVVLRASSGASPLPWDLHVVPYQTEPDELLVFVFAMAPLSRSEERRVGKGSRRGVA